MADGDRSQDQQHPNLHLSPEERRYFGQLFATADTEKIGVVTGEVAVTFFEKTRLPPTTLGEIWQIADRENRGLLTPAGFGIVLRLIGYAQAGQSVSHDLALQPGGPLPKFDGIPGPSTPASPQTTGPLRPQTSGGPIRVPPLTQDKVSQYTSLFEESGAQNGTLPGESAKQIFERAQLPNEVLGRIWNLVDTEQKGTLGLTEFIIAMHLLASFKNGSMRALPQILPAGLYEAAARRGVPRQNTGSRPVPDNVASAIPRQFSGTSFQRTSSPLAGPPRGPTQGPRPGSSHGSGDEWAITPQDKAQFDQIYATVDTSNRGFITGDQAVGFFSNARLPEEALAQIWDLADINSKGQLSRDEFTVAMYLIRQQRSKRDGRDVLPQTLPPNLIPPSMRQQAPGPSQPTAPVFDNASNATAPKKASDDLFGLDALSSPATPSTAPQSNTDSSPYASRAQDSPQLQQPSQQQSSIFKPFVPTSSFGQTIMQPQATGSGRASPTQIRAPPPPPRQSSTMDDLLGDNDPEVSKKLTQETTELGNLSNQVSNLTGQMKENNNKRTSTEQDLSQAQSQKRDFETRLAQLRGAYEQEVREVKALEDQLAASRNHTQKLQQEITLIGASHQDLQSQHRQLAEALAQDQKENDSLKGRIRQTNEEANQLKPQLEKIRSDARQQKGLVAINKKQLATNEAERDRLKSEHEESTRDYHAATRDLEESQRSLEERKRSVDAMSPQPTGAPVTSPEGSTSMNPFFRQRGMTGSSDRGVTSPFGAQNIGTTNHSAFDSFFGPALASSTQSPAPPQTTFGTDTPSQHREASQEAMFTGGSVKSSEDAAIPTPAETPPPSVTEPPSSASVPPAPPKSRQITSSFLPLRNNLQRSDSTSSSVQVAPPASRLGDNGDFDMPGTRDVSFSKPIDPRVEAPKTSAGITSSPPEASPSSSEDIVHTPPTSRGLEKEGSRDLPGAFPGDATPPVHSQKPASESSDDAFHPTTSQPESAISAKNDPFAMPVAKPQTPPSAKDDFESAFASFGSNRNGKAPEPRDADTTFDGFKSNGKAPEPRPGTSDFDDFGKSAPKSRGEFPPIQEFGAEEESDSDSERGFDDDFTASTPQRQPRPINVEPTSLGAGSDESNSAPTRPPITTNDTNTSQLPTPGADSRPPTYDSVTSPPASQPGQRKESNQFPSEYEGLLPSREPLTSPITSPPVKSPVSTTVTSPPDEEGASNFFGGETRAEPMTVGPTYEDNLAKHRSPMAPGASAAPFAYDQSPSQSHVPSQPQPQVPPHLQSQGQPQTPEPSRFVGEPNLQTPPATQTQPPVPAKTAFDDFDDEFGDLSEAKEADDKMDDELNPSRKEGFDEFNPVFDSPATSRSTVQPPSSTFGDNSFNDFESSITGGQGYGPRQVVGQGGSTGQGHDWDAIFAGLDTPQNNGVTSSPTAQDQTFSPPPGPPPSSSAPAPPPAKHQLQRVLSEGTEHDDPILKRLTGMGYPRDQSLAALEKFDYHIDKAADYLTSNS